MNRRAYLFMYKLTGQGVEVNPLIKTPEGSIGKLRGSMKELKIVITYYI